MKQKQIIASIVLLIALVLVVNVNAYQKLCLTKGESIPTYNCTHDLCQLCVTDTLHSTNPNYCSNLKCGDLTTNSNINNTSNSNNNNNNNNNSNLNNNSNSGNPTSSNSILPNITVETLKVNLNSPKNNMVYGKSVLINITSEREVSIYYRNENSDGDWNRIAIDKKNYVGKINFNEGVNNISIRAVDSSGYERNFTVGFYVDSQKPRIKTTEPSKGYADGNFNVEFMEQNPKSLVLKYGNSLQGYREQNVDLDNCSLDSISKCNLNVNLSDYNNKKIYYWFVLRDIGGNSVESKHMFLGVDTIAPLINNMNSSSIVKIDGRTRAVTFNISITESNLANVAYLDNSQRMPRWSVICTKLTNGYCTKKLTFTKGYHDLDIRVMDNAGNSVFLNQSIEFDV